jgi:hypothetical protein
MLVFDADPTRPACVVEFGETERLLRVHAILLELHRRCPGTSLGASLRAVGRGHRRQNQERPPGLPWFRLADTLPTPDAWQSLLERAVGVMQRLHAAITECRVGGHG